MPFLIAHYLHRYAIAYFLPVILRNEMGYSVGAAQCLVAPPYAFAGILMFGTAWLGDKYHVRGPVLIGNAIIGLVGLPILVRVGCPTSQCLF